VFATVDQFAKYDNTLLFFSANEVINNPDTTFSAPYIKAVTRDIKAYIKGRGYRDVPVGYSAADVSEVREDTANYMNCGGNDARSDFFAFNDYSWCSSDFKTAGWDKKVQTYSGYSIPILYVTCEELTQIC
jgi:1,3-beta-glucanosyltransferase GAS5